MNRRMYITEWLNAVGVDKTSLIQAKACSWTTLSRIESGGEYFESTATKIANVLSDKARVPIHIKDLWHKPTKDDMNRLARAPTHVAVSPEDCIDLDDLKNNPLVRIDGKPLSEEAQRMYEFMLQALRSANQ